MRRRPGNEIALHQIAAEIATHQELDFRFHTLGDHPRPEHMRHVDGVAHKVALARIPIYAGNEMPIDLHIIDRLVAEHSQPVEAGTEIVDRQLEAGKPQLPNKRRKIRHLAVVEPLRQLEAERGRGDVDTLEVIDEALDDIPLPANQP